MRGFAFLGGINAARIITLRSIITFVGKRRRANLLSVVFYIILCSAILLTCKLRRKSVFLLSVQVWSERGFISSSVQPFLGIFLSQFCSFSVPLKSGGLLRHEA